MREELADRFGNLIVRTIRFISRLSMKFSDPEKDTRGELIFTVLMGIVMCAGAYISQFIETGRLR